MKELTIQNGEDEEPYFHPKFLIMKYLKMSDADLELNEKIKREEALKKQSEGGDNGGEDKDDAESTADDLLGGGDEDNSGDDLLGGGDKEDAAKTEDDDGIDSEMLGDVQPESSETTQA
jgi:hypothetical protein